MPAPSAHRPRDTGAGESPTSAPIPELQPHGHLIGRLDARDLKHLDLRPPTIRLKLGEVGRLAALPVPASEPIMRQAVAPADDRGRSCRARARCAPALRPAGDPSRRAPFRAPRCGDPSAAARSALRAPASSSPLRIAERTPSAICLKTGRSLVGSIAVTTPQDLHSSRPAIPYPCPQTQSDSPKHSVSVAAAILDDAGRFPVIRRADNGHWEPPGGVLELDESITDGLIREVHEETGARRSTARAHRRLQEHQPRHRRTRFSLRDCRWRSSHQPRRSRTSHGSPPTNSRTT